MNVLGSKQPYEEYHVEFNFTKMLGSNEDLSSVESVSMEGPDGEDVTETMIDGTLEFTSSKSAYVFIKGGESGVVYKITCKIVGSAESHYEMDANIRVVEL